MASPLKHYANGCGKYSLVIIDDDFSSEMSCIKQNFLGIREDEIGDARVLEKM